MMGAPPVTAGRRSQEIALQASGSLKSPLGDLDNIIFDASFRQYEGWTKRMQQH
jgi:hypothetical protein